MNFQNSVTQNQAYIAGHADGAAHVSAFTTRPWAIWKTSRRRPQTLASSNQTLDPTNVAQLQSQAQDYLKQLTDDLNQQIGGRYIYSGSRYTTAPVIDLSTLTTAPSCPFHAHHIAHAAGL